MNNSYKKVVLHISHTDIRTDSRILKELNSLDETGGYSMHAIGVSSTDEAPAAKYNDNVKVQTLNLFTSQKKWSPRILRHLLTLMELFWKMTLKGRRLSPDIVHCHDTLVLPIGFLLKKLTGCKLIYDAHELESDKNGQNFILSKATLLVEKFCWKSIDSLISVSPSIIDWYDSNLGVKPSTLILNSPVLEVGNSLERSALAEKYFHQEYSIPTENLVFIYLGILGPGRGIENILEAFSSDEVRSHVVFMGFGEFESKIIQSSKVNSNIHFHPAVKHDEVVSYTKHADVGLCLIERISLSDYYCLPNKLFEYALSGLPILASDFPDLSSYVKEYKLGMTSNIEPSGITSSIIDFESRGVQTVASELTDLKWDAQSTRLKKMYSTILS